jgi:gamma-glutamyltranspeptidase/glutathione hydrolase
MNPQAALDAPRFNWLQGRDVALEADVSDECAPSWPPWPCAAAATGEPLHYGGGQVILRDPDTGVLISGTEPRNDSAVAG